MLAACSSSTGHNSTAPTSPSGSTTPTTVPVTKSSPTTTIANCDGKRRAFDTSHADVSTFKPVTPDTLTVVTSLPSPGFWNTSEHDHTDVTSGYEYAIAQALQQAFGLPKLVVRNEKFDSITAGAVSKFDVALARIPITCTWSQRVGFSLPYFTSWQGALVRARLPVTTFARAKTARWGAESGSTAMDVLGALQPISSPRGYEQLSDAYQALESGKLDAVLTDTSEALGEASQTDGKLAVTSQFKPDTGPDRYAVLFPKGSTNIGAVNTVLTQLYTSGELSRWARKYLTADPAHIPFITIPASNPG